MLTQVTTTRATSRDDAATGTIQADLVRRGLAPDRQVVDAGYLSAAIRVASQTQRGITLVGPVRENASWQAKAGDGYAASDFLLEWATKTATCPQGKSSATWREVPAGADGTLLQIHFRHADCQACPVRDRCTRASRRSITVHLRVEHEAQEGARAFQATAAFATEYALRAGIEATISQAVRRCDVRDARYRGLAKTRLQYLLTGAALNLIRVADWFAAPPPRGDRRAPFVHLLATACP